MLCLKLKLKRLKIIFGGLCDMIDISDAKFIPNSFGGSEKKKTIIYNDRVYMVKFPDPIRELNNDLSYMNNAYSENIGCNILKTLGFEVQNTFLAIYKESNAPEKIVVACEDFTQDGARLSEFSKLLLSDVDNTRSNIKKSCSIEAVMDCLAKDKLLSAHTEIQDKFWELMVADTLIGNQDRHLDNWGVLFENDSVRFAPIYDCGSSLSALVSDSEMQRTIEDESDFRDMEYNISSPYSYCGKRIFCASFFQNPPEQLVRAVK